MKVLVAGAGGFIGGHCVEKLLGEGHEVLAVDIKPLYEWFQLFDGARNYEADLSDLRTAKVLSIGCDQIYNFAANMGGMGFIASHRVDCMESVFITANMFRAACENNVGKVFYASSACIYPDFLQGTQYSFLKEEDAWPADPEPGYGLEKLYGEQLAKFWHLEHGLDVRVARFHNIFGPHTSYDGGREKAPAAICRKVAMSILGKRNFIDIWGDGKQTRSFLYIDECLDGVWRLMDSDYVDPLNIGSEELVTIDELVDMVEDVAGLETRLVRHYDLSAPQGVRGRCSENSLCEEVLGWKPSRPLSEGLAVTFDWVLAQMRR